MFRWCLDVNKENHKKTVDKIYKRNKEIAKKFKFIIGEELYYE